MKEINFNEYFNDIIGVTKPDGVKPINIVMRFVPSFAAYIRTKPISPYQKHKDLADGSLEVRLELIPNKELFSLLLSYGAQVTILEPASLARQIKQEFNRAADQY